MLLSGGKVAAAPGCDGSPAAPKYRSAKSLRKAVHKERVKEAYVRAHLAVRAARREEERFLRAFKLSDTESTFSAYDRDTSDDERSDFTDGSDDDGGSRASSVGGGGGGGAGVIVSRQDEEA
jgi:uncharacterized membrane protein